MSDDFGLLNFLRLEFPPKSSPQKESENQENIMILKIFLINITETKEEKEETLRI
jgi:hypothetical protein